MSLPPNRGMTVEPSISSTSKGLAPWKPCMALAWKVNWYFCPAVKPVTAWEMLVTVPLPEL